MKKASLFKKVLSVFLTFVMLLTMIPAITLVFKDEQTAHAYGTYSKQKSTEYYYASGTQFIASGILYYSGSSNEKATNWLKDNGWTPLGVNFNAGDGKSSDYIHYGVKYTTDPTKAITAYAVRDSGDRPNTYSGKTYNGTMVTWYKVGSGAATITPTGGDGVVDLNQNGGGNDLTLYATNAYEAGPAVTSATHYQGGNGESTRNNLLNGGYTPAQDQNGNWQDCNEGQGGDHLYWGYKSSCTTVNSNNLRTAYNYAKYQYENGYSSASGLATALTNAENTLSDLNDGYTTRSQSTIDQYTRALYEAMPTISANTEYNVAINTADMQRYFKFTPSSSGTYVFYSYGSGDTKGYIYNKTTSGTSIGSQVAYNDDAPGYIKSTLGNNSNQFYMTANLTAGTTYYFMVRFYSTNTGTVKFKVANARNITFNTTGGATTTTLTLPQGHSFTFSNARTTGDAAFTRDGHTLLAWSTSGTGAEAKAYMNSASVSVPSSDKTYYALWNPTNPTTLAVNTDYTATISAGSQIVYYQFTPSKTKKYLCYGLSSDDTFGLLYNASTYASDASYIKTSDDDGKTDFGQSSNQFYFAETLTAGTKYLFGVKYYNAGTGSIPFRFEEVYNVTYNANGGSGAPAAQEKFYNKAISLSSTVPTRTGYTFLGWATSSTATSASYQPGASYSANADAVLYAVWKANTYAVTLDNQSATTAGTTIVTATYAANMPSATMPAKTGYTFGGYYDGENGTGTQYYTASGTSARTWNKAEASTLYAKWTINQYTITFKGADGTVLKTQTLDYGVMPTAPSIPAKSPDATYHYTGAWDKTVVAAAADTTYTVVYSAIPHSGGTANCVDKAVCTNCGTAYGSVNANNHKTVVNDAKVDATCVSTGLTAGLHCNACNKVLTAQNTIGKLEHSYTGDVKNNNNGTHSFKCVNGCNEYGGTVNCTFGEWTTTTAPGCTTKGSHKHTCTVCNYTAEEDIAPNGHTMTKTAAKAATCTEAGNNEYYTCFVCNKVFKDEAGNTETTVDAEILTALGHTMTKTAAKAATCTEAGNNEYYTCSVCEKVFKDEAGATETTVAAETFAALGHTMTKTAAKAATCTEAGNNEYYTCSVCEKVFKDEAGATETTVAAETLAALGHTMTKTAAKAATCTEAGNNEYYTCSVCEKVFKEEAGTTETTAAAEALAALGHKITKTAAKAATCTEAGNNEYYTCSVCEKVFKDEAGAVETTVEVETLAALGHAYGALIAEVPANCISTGIAAHYICSVCEKIFTADKTEVASPEALTIEIDPYVHCGETYTKNENTVDATCASKGSYDFVTYCSDCDAELSREPKEIAIDPAKHTGINHTENYLDSTCTEVGYTGDTVCECGVKLADGEEIALKPHTYGEWEVTLSATCMAKGTEKRTCANCPAYEEREIAIAPDNHTNVTHIENAKNATCTEVGYTGDTYCECGVMLIEGTEIGMEAHDYGEWKTVTAATCMAKGLAKRTCADCSAFETKELDTDPANHTGVNHTENYLDSTCTEVGYTGDTVCECGAKLASGEEIALKEHIYGEWEVTLSATCMAKGTEKHTCVNCPAYEEREIAIASDNHTNVTHIENAKEATCTAVGYTGDTVCECGAVIVKGSEIAKLAHEYVVVSETPSTFESNGKRVYECSVCGEKMEEELPKSATCEYCGTDHHFFLAKVVCAVIKAIYHMVALFKGLGA